LQSIIDHDGIFDLKKNKNTQILYFPKKDFDCLKFKILDRLITVEIISNQIDSMSIFEKDWVGNLNLEHKIKIFSKIIQGIFWSSKIEKDNRIYQNSKNTLLNFEMNSHV